MLLLIGLTIPQRRARDFFAYSEGVAVLRLNLRINSPRSELE
jgi:hypothetical protein